MHNWRDQRNCPGELLNVDTPRGLDGGVYEDYLSPGNTTGEMGFLTHNTREDVLTCDSEVTVNKLQNYLSISSV